MEGSCAIVLFLADVTIVEQGVGDEGVEAGLKGSAATGRLIVENCGAVLVFGFTAKRLIGPSSRFGDFLDDEI